MAFASSYFTGACTGRSAGFSPFRIRVGCSAPELIDDIRSVGDQAAAGDEEAFPVDRRQFVPGGKGDDQITVEHCQCARCHE
jgi:hypothetical protein